MEVVCSDIKCSVHNSMIFANEWIAQFPCQIQCMTNNAAQSLLVQPFHTYYMWMELMMSLQWLIIHRLMLYANTYSSLLTYNMHHVMCSSFWQYWETKWCYVLSTWWWNVTYDCNVCWFCMTQICTNGTIFQVNTQHKLFGAYQFCRAYQYLAMTVLLVGKCDFLIAFIIS